MGIIWRDFSGEGEEKNREEKVWGRRSIIGRHKINGERSKNGIENREPRELICKTRGHELSVCGGNAGGLGAVAMGKLRGKMYRKEEA